MTTITEFYQFVDVLKEKAMDRGETRLWRALEDALHLGSSGLEIVGAISMIIVDNEALLKRMLDGDAEGKLKSAVAFVDRAYGRK